MAQPAVDEKYKTASKNHKQVLDLFAGQQFPKDPDLISPLTAILNLSDKGAAKILRWFELKNKFINEGLPDEKAKSSRFDLSISDLNIFLQII